MFGVKMENNEYPVLEIAKTIKEHQMMRTLERSSKEVYDTVFFRVLEDALETDDYEKVLTALIEWSIIWVLDNGEKWLKDYHSNSNGKDF